MKIILILLLSFNVYSYDQIDRLKFCQAVAKQFEILAKEEHQRCLEDLKEYNKSLKEFQNRFTKKDQELIDKVKAGYIYINKTCDSTVGVWDKNHFNRCLVFMSGGGL